VARRLSNPRAFFAEAATSKWQASESCRSKGSSRDRADHDEPKLIIQPAG
jgi:hypothetical protein